MARFAQKHRQTAARHVRAVFAFRKNRRDLRIYSLRDAVANRARSGRSKTVCAARIDDFDVRCRKSKCASEYRAKPNRGESKRWRPLREPRKYDNLRAPEPANFRSDLDLRGLFFPQIAVTFDKLQNLIRKASANFPSVRLFRRFARCRCRRNNASTVTLERGTNSATFSFLPNSKTPATVGKNSSALPTARSKSFLKIRRFDKDFCRKHRLRNALAKLHKSASSKSFSFAPTTGIFSYPSGRISSSHVGKFFARRFRVFPRRCGCKTCRRAFDTGGVCLRCRARRRVCRCQKQSTSISGTSGGKISSRQIRTSSSCTASGLTDAFDAQAGR